LLSRLVWDGLFACLLVKQTRWFLQVQPINSAEPLDPGLYLVGTPIGNLQDITLRALRVIATADAVLAEDTRHSRRLLDRHEISRPLTSCHQFNERARVDWAAEQIAAGRSVALITDAGMPGVSDPGSRLARGLRERGLNVFVVPGPCSVSSAVALSGFCDGGYVFVGFPPNKSAGRRRLVEALREERRAVVLFESTHRFKKLLADLAELQPERELFVGRELTKRHEEGRSGLPAELAVHYETHSVKGEFVLVLAPLGKK